MRRRHLLCALGGTMALGLAGCLSDGGTPTDEESAAGDEPTKTTASQTTRTGWDWDPGTAEPFQTIRVGTRSGVDFPGNNRPPEIKIWNDAATARPVTVTLRTPDTTRMSTSVEFPTDGWLRMVVNEPGAHTLELAIDGESAGELDVGGWFDCNDTTSNVIIHADGTLSSRTVSTEVACRGPAVRGQTFSAGPGSCDGSEDAIVTFDNETVTVSGRITTPTPCYDLELASVTLENAEEFQTGGDDVLVVIVATAGPEDGACVDCIGSVPYTAAVDFEYAYPSAVRVVHRSMDETRTVQTVTRDG